MLNKRVRAPATIIARDAGVESGAPMRLATRGLGTVSMFEEANCGQIFELRMFFFRCHFLGKLWEEFGQVLGRVGKGLGRVWTDFRKIFHKCVEPGLFES